MRGDGGGRYLAASIAVLTALVGLGLLSRRYSRYLLAGSSMAPAFRDGDWLIVDRLAYGSRVPRGGEVVLAPDPREPNRLLVKRVMHVDMHGGAWLQGDNTGASTDSRHFGAVSVDSVVGRVVGRYWPIRRRSARSASTTPSVGNASSGGVAGSK